MQTQNRVETSELFCKSLLKKESIRKKGSEDRAPDRALFFLSLQYSDLSVNQAKTVQ